MLACLIGYKKTNKYLLIMSKKQKKTIMRKLILLLAMFGTVYVASAATITVNANITSNTTWLNTNTYVLSGFVYVTSGATLTIQPGTLILGNFATKGSLIITKGAKMNAAGTANQPIVFTSQQDAGLRAPGDWGGVILLGQAPINVPGGSAVIEGGLDPVLGSYGGTDPLDNSGVMTYVRIEYAGVPFLPNNEINSLTMGGVGSGTIIDYIQVSNGFDDGYEWFGGTVNAKHLISYNMLDDDFDTDFGYSGKVQFGVAIRDKNLADISASNGFESDNDAAGSANSPFTSPVFSNMTLVGPNETLSTVVNSNFRAAMRLRRNTKLKVYNSILMGWPAALNLDGTTVETNATNGDLQFQNNISAGIVNPTVHTSTTPNFAVNFVATSGFNNSTLTNNTDVLLTSPFTAPLNFVPQAGSPAYGAASFVNSNLSSFEVTTYAGAFGTTDWTSCWSNYDPQNTVYDESTPINGGPTVTISAPGSSQFCITKLLTAQTSPVVSYQWFVNNVAINGATAATYTATASGSYKVTVTNAAGCQNTSPVKQLTKKPAPVIPIIRASCNSLGQTTLGVIGNYAAIQWRLNNVNISGGNTPSIVATTAGTYTVVVTGVNGCTAVSASRVAPVSTLPTTSLTAAKCNKFNYSLSTGTLTSTNVAGTTERYFYKFNQAGILVGTRQSGVNNPSITLASVAPALAVGQVYDVTVQVVDGGDTSCVGAVCQVGISTAIQENGNGEFEALSADEEKVSPLTVYPNPAVGISTTLSFTLAKDAVVSINVFDVNGKMVSNATNDSYSAGENNIEFNSTGLSKGIYSLQLLVDGIVMGNSRLSIVE
jgi:Secretion system C-terminal sorting domain